MTKNRNYQSMLYRELLALARKRGVKLSGGKAALVSRLLNDDNGLTGKNANPSREVTSKGRIDPKTGDKIPGQKFVICGCGQWEKRCACEKPKDKRSEGTGSAAESDA